MYCKTFDNVYMIKLFLMFLNVIFISNIVMSKLNKFDLFFINNRIKIIKVYFRILIKTSIKYGFIIYIISTLNDTFSFNDMIIVMIYEFTMLLMLFVIYEIFSNYKFSYLIVFIGLIYILIANHIDNQVLNYFIIDITLFKNGVYFKCDIFYIILLDVMNVLLYYNIYTRKRIIC